MAPDDHQAVGQDQSLRYGHGRAEGDHIHVSGEIQDRKVDDVDRGAEDGGVVGVLGQAHGGEHGEAADVAGQKDHRRGEHDPQDLSRRGKALAEEDLTEPWRDNEHDGTEDDDQRLHDQQDLFDQTVVVVLDHVGIDKP